MTEPNLDTFNIKTENFFSKLHNPLLGGELIKKVQPYSSKPSPDTYNPDILTAAAIHCLVQQYYDSFKLLVGCQYWDENNTINTLFGVFTENKEPLPLNSFKSIYFKAHSHNLISDTKINKLYKLAVTNPVLSLEELKTVTGKVPASTEFILWACGKSNPPIQAEVELAVNFTKDNFPTLYKDKICGELEIYAKSQRVDLETYSYLKKIYQRYQEKTPNKLGFIQLKKTYKKYKDCKEDKQTLEFAMDYYLHDLLDSEQTKNVIQLMGNSISSVEYLLSHLKSNQSVRDTLFIGCCEMGNEKVLKYFLNQPSFRENYPQVLNQGFITACQNNQIHMARLLMNTQQAPFNINESQLFTEVCKKGHNEIIHYLILELGITKSPQITQFLQKKPYAEHLEELFDKKGLNEKLNNALTQKQTNKNKFKI